ncbi:MAG: anthranilate phosphoribosyltransferase [Desulfobacterales bacterium]|nr:anthranilate phosphoribosyltransferase [Desulfobacterales bacterium]
MWTDDSIKEFGWTIQKLIDKKDLSRRESHEMFRQVLENRQPDLQQGAFLAALTAKGETPGEIAGAWEAIVELDTTPISGEFEGPLVENSGTGMDSLKTFNVSTAAAVAAAAGGVRLARHGARALTSACGTVDLLEEIGIDVECDVETVGKSIQSAGIGIFNGMSPNVHPRSLARILSRIRFGSTLNIAASLASPCRPTHALRGVYSTDLIPKATEVMKEIGYRRAMVVHGFDAEKREGMDELSNIGESVVREFFPDGKEETYTLAPEDVGVKRTVYEKIAATGDRKKEALRFLKVIGGRGRPECVDITCLNAGAILYLAGKAKDIRAGVDASREIIHGGAALKKLSQWVSVQADAGKKGVRRYLDLAGKAGVKREALQSIP